MRKYTDEQLRWIEDNLDAGVFRNQRHFTDVFNALFETDVTYPAMSAMLYLRGWSVKTKHNTPQWTEEMDAWLKAKYDDVGPDFTAIADAFNLAFSTSKSNCCIAKHLQRMGVHDPAPKKGLKNRGCFEKGRPSYRGELPIGTIRYNSDGRPFVKVMLAEGRYAESKGKGHNYREPFWKPLQKKIWEDNYGEVPEGHIVCCLSGDPDERDPTQLCLLDRRGMARMAKNGWWDIDNVEITRTAAAWCNLFYTLQDAERGAR